MGEKEFLLLFGGVLVGILVVIVALFGMGFLHNLSGPNLASQLTLKKPMPVVQFENLLAKDSNFSQVNVSYSGLIKIKSSTGIATSSYELNFTAQYARFENSSAFGISFNIPQSSYSNYYNTYDYELITNGSDKYYCNSQLGSYISQYYTAGFGCIDQATADVLQNTTYNSSLAMFNFLSGKGVKITINQASQGTYNGKSCTALNGTFSGIMPYSQAENLLYYAQIYSFYSYYNTNISIGGSFKTCISNKNYLPLSLNSTIKLTSGSQTVSMQMTMNQTSISNSTSYADTAVPTTPLNLSSILRGYCLSGYSTYSSSQLNGYCSFATLNTTGTLMLKYESYYNNYYNNYGTYGSYTPIDILGIACTQLQSI